MVSDGSTRRVLLDGKDGVRLSGSARWCQMVLHGGFCQMVKMVSGRRIV